MFRSGIDLSLSAGESNVDARDKVPVIYYMGKGNLREQEDDRDVVATDEFADSLP
jgi:hypothetical protein